jgi:threonine dehydrogenase-like Zn-dependent dehydrogenase
MRVTAVDPIDHSEAAVHFGADCFLNMTSSAWLENLQDYDRPQVVVEAVGHQPVTIDDAVRGVANHGYVYAFGAPTQSGYIAPYPEMYERDLTLSSGRTIDGWLTALTAAANYILAQRQAFATFVSHVFPVEEAQQAYSLYSVPQAGRLKVVIATSVQWRRWPGGGGPPTAPPLSGSP